LTNERNALAATRQFLARPPVACFVLGVHLAVLQFSFLFLLEAYVSSRAHSYFICLFFWLLGFQLGLMLKKENLMPRLLLAGLALYELAYVVGHLYPYNDLVFPLYALCIFGAAIQAGYFFPWAAEILKATDTVLIQENNGYLVGLVFSLITVLFYGDVLTAVAPPLLAFLAYVGLDGLKPQVASERAGGTIGSGISA